MTDKKSLTELPFIADISVTIGDIVFATDKRGRVVFWNDEAEKVSGNTVKEVLGKPYTLACRMTPPGAGVDLAAVMSGRDFAGGVRCHGPAGGDVALYLFATVGRNKAGEPAGVVFVGRDVTGLWRVEDAAQASTDKYRLLFDNTLDSVVIADLDGRVLEANPASLRIYGYSSEDAKHMNLADVVAPESRDAAAEAMAALAQGKLVQKSLKMRRKDGTGLVVDMVAIVVTVAGEKRVLSITRDVTARARAEVELKESEQRYRTMFESVGDAVFLETVDGSILEVNENACRLLGYERKELLALKVSDLVPPEARVWLPRITDAILRERTVRTEAVNLHKSGRQIPVELTVSAVELEGKTLVLAIARDISQRKQAERALKESEEKFRGVSEQSPNMIFINRQGRVVYANRKCEEQMGYSREEFHAPGFDFLRLIAPDSLAQIKAVFARHTRGEEVEPYEYALVTKDGRRMETIITTRLIDYEGSKAILGIVTDITERKTTERALRDSEERLRTLRDNVPVGLFRTTPTGEFVSVNPAAVRMFGYAGEAEILKLKVTDLYAEPAERRAMMDRLVRDGRLADVELAVRRRDGSVFPGQLNVETITGPDGRVLHFDGSIQDISARREAERKLRESEGRFRGLLDSSPDGVAVHQDGRVVLMNPAGVRMLGYDTPDALVGISVVDFLHPDERTALLERMRRVVGSDAQVKPAEARFRRRDGTYLPLEVANARIEWKGTPAVQVVFRDVSARREAEQALRESEERFRGLVDASPDAIAVYRDGSIVMANPACTRLLGYDSPDALLGRPASEFVYPDDLPLVADRERALLEGTSGRTQVPLRVRFRHRGGRLVHAEVVAALTTWDGAPAVQVMARDMTEQRWLAQVAEETSDELYAVLNNSPEAIAAESEGVLVYANQRFARLLGYESLAEVVGRPVADFEAPQDREQLAEYTRLRESGQDAPVGYVFRVLKRDGTVVPVEAAISTYRSRGKLHILAFMREGKPGRAER